MKKIISLLLAACFFIGFFGCKSGQTETNSINYIVFTPEQVDIILTKYASTVKQIGAPQITETEVIVDSTKNISIHEISTTRNFSFNVPLDEKNQLIADAETVTARKKNDCPGTGTVTCRLRCVHNSNTSSCNWSGCNSYPCSNGNCTGGCTLLDCKQLRTATGMLYSVMR